jgi:hypothetical protein
MRVVHTTRGYLCVQIGRVDHGRLGELGIDGAFHDDGRFHPLPLDALPRAVSFQQGFDIDCNPEAKTDFAADILGLQPSAANNPRAGVGKPAGRREISFGLLGPKAIQIAYRSGSQTLTSKLLPGLGAYLIVQQATSGERLGSISSTFGGATLPTHPDGALTAITYRYGAKTCTDTGQKDVLHACGLSEGPPPKPAPLPAVQEPLRVHLTVRHHVVTAAVISFRAPYPVTSDGESYSLGARTCDGYVGPSSERDLARGATVRIAVGSTLSYGCSRSMRFTVDYFRSLGGIPATTSLGAVTVRIPPGDHAAPLPKLVKKRLSEARRRRANH